MDKKPNEIHENLSPTKIKKLYRTVLTLINNKNINIPYNWPIGSYLNSGYTSSYALIGIHY